MSTETTWDLLCPATRGTGACTCATRHEDARPRGVVPPGTYAQGSRSPVVHVKLCASCAGYPPMTSPDYSGFLSGLCQGCGGNSRELHRFPAVIGSAAGCSCTSDHKRVTGDLPAGAE